MNIRRYKSPYSKTILTTTIILMLAFHGVFISCMKKLYIYNINEREFWYYLACFTIATSIVMIAFLFQIKGVSVNNDYLFIHRPIGKIRIKRNEITRIERKDSLCDDRGLLRSVYFFGHYGKYKSKKDGIYQAYVKNCSQLIFIETKHKKYVVSCDNRDEVVALF